MTRLRLALGAGALLAVVAAFVAGRYTAPARVETRTVIDEAAVSRAVAAARAEWTRNVEDHTITRTVYRDGKVTERIVYVDREVQAGGSAGASSTTTTAAGSTAASSAARPVAMPPGWRAGLAASWDLRERPAWPERWGLEADRRIVGPLWIGLRADTTGRAGLAVTVEW